MTKKVIRKKLTTSGGILCLSLTKDLIGDLKLKNNSTVEISKAKGGKRLIIDFIEEEPETIEQNKLVSIPVLNIKQLLDFSFIELDTLKDAGKVLITNGIEYPLEVIGQSGGIIKKSDRQKMSKAINQGLEKNLFDEELTGLIKELLPKIDD